MTNRRWLFRLLLLAALVAAGAVLAVMIGLPTQTQLRSSFAQYGWWAGIAFAALYAAVTLTPLPKAVFSLAAGVAFGLAQGLLVVMVGATVGATVAFALARRLGRDAVARLTGTTVVRIDTLVAEHGRWSVVVARLIPVVPFTALNYLFGLSRVRTRDYLVGTVVGILPGTAAYVTVGSFGAQTGAWPLWAGLAWLVLLTVFGSLLARRRRDDRRRASVEGIP